MEWRDNEALLPGPRTHGSTISATGLRPFVFPTMLHLWREIHGTKSAPVKPRP